MQRAISNWQPTACILLLFYFLYILFSNPDAKRRLPIERARVVWLLMVRSLHRAKKTDPLPFCLLRLTLQQKRRLEDRAEDRKWGSGVSRQPG